VKNERKTPHRGGNLFFLNYCETFVAGFLRSQHQRKKVGESETESQLWSSISDPLEQQWGNEERIKRVGRNNSLKWTNAAAEAGLPDFQTKNPNLGKFWCSCMVDVDRIYGHLSILRPLTKLRPIGLFTAIWYNL
jgi:hypothetical protein